ncbi:hypothetical protein T552_00390 [Pneumocystis carinii B80]|uniref:Nascent polypeptide-associated complex subunit beta n=1 Tax=Pneumocystis carinii (strain B80) TaxID=1408658 RepID=A0A0W4ZQM7_PNEC8|nr:hypothetical protein T552_00390 [Pneumocystis carinii B80]KTW30677.1 hypothetical protein T552_00390 [Pneumocystis carinii B80]
MDDSKLSKLQTNVRIGGKGTPRRKKKVVHRTQCDDKKLQSSLKKLNAQSVGGVSEANIFKAGGSVTHFSAPKVLACITSNMFVISGFSEEKELTDLVPGILNQLGRDSLASLRKLTGNYTNLQKTKENDPNGDDDYIPDLVEVFDAQD